MIFVDFCDFRVRAPWISLTLVILLDFDDFRVRVPWISLTLLILVDFYDFRVRAPWISLTLVIFVEFTMSLYINLRISGRYVASLRFLQYYFPFCPKCICQMQKVFLSISK